jgi:hypothetical protein
MTALPALPQETSKEQVRRCCPSATVFAPNPLPRATALTVAHRLHFHIVAQLLSPCSSICDPQNEHNSLSTRAAGSNPLPCIPGPPFPPFGQESDSLPFFVNSGRSGSMTLERPNLPLALRINPSDDGHENPLHPTRQKGREVPRPSRSCARKRTRRNHGIHCP